MTSLRQESTRYIEIPVTADVTASDITVSVTPGSAAGTFYPVASFTDGVAQFLVGPNSAIGRLTPGINRVFVHLDGMDPQDPEEFSSSVWVEGGEASSDPPSDGDIDGGDPDSFPDGDPA